MINGKANLLEQRENREGACKKNYFDNFFK